MEFAKDSSKHGLSADDHDRRRLLPWTFSGTSHQRVANTTRIATLFDNPPVYSLISQALKLKVPAEEYAVAIIGQLADSWLPRIYQRILKLRTRSYRFNHQKSSAEVSIQHTLLGVELKIGRRRALCPDLATARYLQVFARIGCTEVAVPYDITRISLLADELESSWHRMLLLVDHQATERSEKFRIRLRGLLFAKIREEILEAGPGTRIPEFKSSTKQRRN